MSDNPHVAPVLRLWTLGCLAVEGDPAARPRARAQRRPLALLALLAAAGERGVSRDKLLAYLWPETGAQEARHRLTQTLYVLRKDLGADDLVLGSGDLRLNPAVLPADLWEFELALERGDREHATAVYRGPFLDGFFLSGASEFERWVETERARLAERAAGALEALARTAAASGEHRSAAQWWRRLSVLDPLDSGHALGLMQALAAMGDRAGALRHARSHAQLVEQELGSRPDPAVVALIRQLRAPSGEEISGAVPATPSTAHRGDARPFARALAERYVIERALGRGGTSRVYLARDLKHDRAVALKVLHPELASGVTAERFLREIRLLARLRHPHILPLYDSGEADGYFFYVTPYLAGGSLRARLECAGRLPVGEALQLTCEVADALDYAHAHGVLHRNIKPDNILVDDGHAVVAGFGIVRALNIARQEHLTVEGLRMGTPGYMSPEQAACAAELDGRSDIYSLGCVLYELLAGAPPFTGGGAEAVIARHVTDPAPRIQATRPDIPAPIDAVASRALARLPSERFPTAGEFARALAQASRGANRETG
jgi:DNA-binding SARP family transcriptional activator/tRNA A-37 threonylcarbamoyl transferase component Bud32